MVCIYVAAILLSFLDLLPIVPSTFESVDALIVGR